MVAGGEGSPLGRSETGAPGAGADEDAVPFFVGLPDTRASALTPGSAEPDGEAEAPPGAGAAAEPEAEAEAPGVAPGLPDTAAPLGAGRTSAFSARFWSCPESGSQGALELPPSTATTSVTAYTALTAASTQPTRRYVLLRRPLSSTKTGPSAGSGGAGSTGSSES